MHILLTDVLTCPRCGPQWGLIVLAERMESRQVVEGQLGCANCREEYPVRGGVAELRVPSDAPVLRVEGAPDGGAPEDAAFRLAALLGVGESTGTVFVLSADPTRVPEVARLLPNVQTAGLLPEGAAAPAGEVSWVRHGALIPFRTRGLRGVAVSGELPAGALPELVRVLAPGARLVLDPAPPDAARWLTEAGLKLLLEQDGVVVASSS